MNKDYVLITGASSGIGFEFAHEFAKRGNYLILTARSKDKLEELAEELRKLYLIKVEVIAIDLSKINSGSELYSHINKLGHHVKVLVNNAGFGDHGPFVNSNLNKQQQMIHLNCTSLVDLCHIFLPPMILKKSGFILNVASTAAFQPGPYMSVYYATKAFVLSFSESLSAELEGTGVSVTALCPGPTISGFSSAAGLKNLILFDKFKLPTSAEAAQFGIESMERGKVVAVHLKINYILTLISRVTPKFAIRKVMKFLQKGR